MFGGGGGGGGGPGPEYYAQVAENSRIQAANAAAMQQLQSQWAENDKSSQANAAQAAKNDAARLESEKQAKIQAENDLAARAQDSASQSASSTLASLNLTQQAADAAKKQQMQISGSLAPAPTLDSTAAAGATFPVAAAKPTIPSATDVFQAPLTNQFSPPTTQGLKFGGGY